FASLAAAAFAAGMFVVGGQSVLYALAAMYYPTAMRGTAEPTPVVIGASIPVTLVAAVAALLLIRRPRAGD
ncbi:3-(3-hydroxy-phenyl)propionate transporter MhpT, partial [Burkholderia cenocepacia]|nr:3-(3-hydroxy-phenyl)propionate transporter MhpT [Burkholderia cenocepacia]